MTLEIFLERIGLPEDARAAVLAYEITAEETARLLTLYDTDYGAFVKELNGNSAEPNLSFLAIYCRWALGSLIPWEKTGVPEEIAMATMRDITLWSGRYRERTGKIGLIEWGWFRLHKAVGLFRLGRLQFEPQISNINVTLPDGREIHEGTPVLSVHIPQGERMSAEQIKESFDMSKEFFPKYFGKEYDTYVCTSWLLAPALGQMIKEDSSIAALRKYFYVYGEDTSYSQAEDYVFLMADPDKSSYPENTSLQRNLKRYLMDGGVMGMGKGVCIY